MGTQIARSIAPHLDDATTILTWRVTTRRALTRPVTASFLSVVRQRLRQFSFDTEAVGIVLHEAIANAAIHGNLGIAASGQDGLESPYELSCRMQASLADEVLASRPLVISALRQPSRLILTVRDSGAGFDIANVAPPDPGRAHGRGIQLMRAMAASVDYHHGGRLVCLGFPLQPLGAVTGLDPADQASNQFVLSSRILIADDSRTQREMLAHALRKAGFTDIVQAIDGNEAVRLFHETEPDLLLVDLAMPGMDGIEVCTTILARQAESVPIMILSAVLAAEERVRAVQSGAVDFIVKPVYPPELIARVRMQLEKNWLLQSLRRFRERLHDELWSARLMQESLMPSRQTLQSMRASTGLDIAARTEMCSELGGDLWGVRIIDDKRLGLFIADFTGHGVASAINAFRLHSTLCESGIRFERPDLVMQALNVRLAGVLPVGSFATLFYAVIDTGRDRLDYTAAGAPSPLLAMPDGSLTEIDSTGVPAGVTPWQNYPVKTLAFPPGAAIFLYSDALVEARDEDGQSWSMDRLRAALAPNLSATSDEQADALLRQFNEGRPRPLPDDLTLIFVRRVIKAAALPKP